jgi:hypothetical protein
MKRAYIVENGRSNTIYCIYLSFQHNHVRGEYGERTKTTRCSIRVPNNLVCYAIYRLSQLLENFDESKS